MSDVRYFLQECLERVFILFFNIDYCADVFLVAGEWDGEECSLINTSPSIPTLLPQEKHLCSSQYKKSKNTSQKRDIYGRVSDKTCFRKK